MKQTSAVEAVHSERTALVQVLRQAGSTAPTLCEGWETRHLLAHLLLRESKPLVVPGMGLPFLAGHTDRVTNQLADELLEQRRYEKALDDFAALPGYFGMRRRFPALDAAMNTIEYFVHIEDVRRAADSWQPRDLEAGVQQKIWADLLKRGGLMARKRFAAGLVLEAPGYSPAAAAVLAPKPGTVAPVLTGEPGELVLYLFGRRDVAQVELS
ncbi:MAG: TIGR03085 family metal-binding protein [Rothia sp. (in: high G+C Gram-positive bacteria)]|nr:TIGR03085 family metal-binding protein [Rothia sp. (in: high G+C Gram-positive bacteria)]